jgi:hypothetical protein
MSGSIKQNALEDFKPYFGGDEKGLLFTQALYRGTDYTSLQFETQQQLKGTMMEQLLRACNYKNFNRNVDGSVIQQDEDVHQDVVDLVIKTALFHRKIDRTTTKGTNLGQLYQSVKESLNLFLNSKLTLTSSDWQMGETTNATRTFASNEVNLNKAYGLTTADSVGKALVMRLADYLIDYNYKSTTGALVGLGSVKYSPSTGVEWTYPITFTKGYLYNGANNLGEILEKLIGDCETNAGGICMMSVFSDKPDSRMAGTVNKAINQIDAMAKQLGGASRADMIKIIQDGLVNITKRVLETIWSDIHAAYAGGDMGAGPSPKLNANTVKAIVELNVEQYVNLFQNLVNTEIIDKLNQYINKNATVKHTDLTSGDAKALAEQIHKRWSDLSADARQFYGAHCLLYAKTGSVYLNGRSVAGQEWVELTPEETMAVFTYKGSFDGSMLRLNLRKITKGSAQTVLEATLPAVQTGSRLWFTDKNGDLKQVRGHKDDILRSIYNSVYSGALDSSNTLTVGSVVMNNVENDCTKISSKGFSLNYAKFIPAVLEGAEKLAQQLIQSSTQSKPSINDLTWLNVRDAAYGNIWRWNSDKKNYERNVNGKWTEFNDMTMGDQGTCYSTYLANGDGEKCKRIIECLADGDPKSLRRCLTSIRDDDLWKVAENDVTSVHPDMVKLVLKKFGVKARRETDENGVQYKVPMTYDQWISEEVGKMDNEVKSAIMETPNLRNYIKALLHICRSNLSVLNKQNITSIAKESVPSYFQNLAMKKYKIPHVDDKKSSYEFFAESLRNSFYPMNTTNDLYNNIISGSMTNALFMNPFTVMAPGMTGGAREFQVINAGLQTIGTNDIERGLRGLNRNGSGDTFTKIFIGLNSGLREVGLKIHPDDMQRIRGAIKEIGDLEDKLGKLSMVLKVFIDITRAHGITLANIDSENIRTVKLSDISNMDDLKNYLFRYIKDLSKNMAQNLNAQRSLNYELMYKVAPMYADECAGKKANVQESAPAVSSGDKWIDLTD